MVRYTVQPKTYEYKPLKKGEIRILHLQPGEISDTVLVELSHEVLGPDIAHYHALSYEWGCQRPSDEIRIKDKNSASSEVRTLTIKPNLCAALKHLRWRDKIRRLWVDAICIAQIEQTYDQANPSQRLGTALQANNKNANGMSPALGDPYEDACRAKKDLMNGGLIENMKTEADKENDVKTVPAVSDDQKDLEKSNQIMNKIYGQAKEVSVWLGDEDNDSARAIRLTERLAQLKDFDTIAELEKNEDGLSMAYDLEALIKFLKRGWFSRRWVVQEIALAQDAMVYCGNEAISWANVADAVALLEKVGRNGAINRILKRLPVTNHVPEYIGQFSSLPAYRLVQNTTGLFRGRESKYAHGFKTWRYTLEELVSFLAAFKASRAHDTIYAILGLASDFEPVHPSHIGSKQHIIESKRGMRRQDTLRSTDWSTVVSPFQVNYNIPVLAVFKEFLNHAIRKSKSLDILCRPWAPTSGLDAKGKLELIDLPSWIPSLSRKPFQAKRDGNMVRYNPDPLVGPAVFRHRLYCASGIQDADFEIDLKDPLSKLMTVAGFVLDTVEETWDSAAFGNVPVSWLQAGHWDDVNQAPPDELWRTLVADRNAHGDDPDRWYPLVFQSTAKERGLDYGFETYRLIYESGNTPVAEVFRRVQAVVWNRRLIRTQGQFMDWFTQGERTSGALGLAPGDTRKGDLICIIFGCSVPLILRRATPAKSKKRTFAVANGEIFEEPEEMEAVSSPSRQKTVKHDGEVFNLVGECYIDHMMDGEAMAYFRNSEPKVPRREFVME